MAYQTWQRMFEYWQSSLIGTALYSPETLLRQCDEPECLLANSSQNGINDSLTQIGQYSSLHVLSTSHANLSSIFSLSSWTGANWSEFVSLALQSCEWGVRHTLPNCLCNIASLVASWWCSCHPTLACCLILCLIASKSFDKRDGEI